MKPNSQLTQIIAMLVCGITLLALFGLRAGSSWVDALDRHREVYETKTDKLEVLAGETTRRLDSIEGKLDRILVFGKK